MELEADRALVSRWSAARNQSLTEN